jgi:hypothetical protein
LFCRFFIPALIYGLVYSTPVSAYGASLDCTESSVTFEWDEAGAVECACPAAKASIAFLESLGLETRQPINVKLVKQVPSSLDSNVLGIYAPVNANEIVLLNYKRAAETSQLYKPQVKIDMSENLWCGYVAHELAHAISGQYHSSRATNRLAMEYISAVTQLAIFSTETRKMFLKTHGGVDAYQSIAEMSELYFLLDPNKFAVKCYLHFISLDNPKAFVRRLFEENDGF